MPAALPLEYRGGAGGGAMCRQPVVGRLDNIPQCYPPIMELLTEERRKSGVVGHFSSRRPLLGTTADEEGSIPMPARSTQAMFPDPMPPRLWQPDRDVVERADWRLVEQPLLTGSADHVESQRRLHQDRGNYRRPVLVDEIGERELTYKPLNTDWPFRPVPTDRTSVDLRRGGGYTSVQRGSVGNSFEGGGNITPERQYLTRQRKGGEFVVNRDPLPLKTLVSHGAGVQVDHRPSLHVETDVSGNRTNLHQGNIRIDTRTFRNRDTRRTFRVQASGNRSKLTSEAVAYGYSPFFLYDIKPEDSTIDTHVSFGPSLFLDFAADRHQKVRTHLFEHRPEIRSDPRTTQLWEKHTPPRTLFDRPPVRGHVHRVTDRESLLGTGRYDVGRVNEALRVNPTSHDAHHFYGKLQARRSGTAGPQSIYA